MPGGAAGTGRELPLELDWPAETGGLVEEVFRGVVNERGGFVAGGGGGGSGGGRGPPEHCVVLGPDIEEGGVPIAWRGRRGLTLAGDGRPRIRTEDFAGRRGDGDLSEGEGLGESGSGGDGAALRSQVRSSARSVSNW